MIATIVAATMAFSPRTDTTLAVTPTETRLVVENYAGDVSVTTWNKNALRVEADHSSRTVVEIERDGSTVSIKPRSRMGGPMSVDFQITVPAAMAIEITGVYADVAVHGAQGPISVETVRGDVSVTGGAGRIALKSVEGDVSLERARGRAELSSVNSGVAVKQHDGDLVAETVNGEIALEDIRGGTVEASTVNGDVLYDGELRDGGRYQFTTHNGDITVALPAQPSVSVSVTTYSGEFDSSFPMKVVSSHRNRRMRFTLGSGGSELELESFQGAIRLEQRGSQDLERARKKMKGQKEQNSNDENPNEGKE